MSKTVKIISSALGVLVVIAATAYVFMTPYVRIPGVRIGGTLSPPPADWHSVDNHGVVQLKNAGFPPFVVNVFYTTNDGGIITATRPDGGYWAKRARSNPDGYMRLGDNTYALTSREILGDERMPYLEAYGAKNRMNMNYDFTGEIIPTVNEPLYTWEVFYWTPRT